ncbi:MAG: tetratricopeptide repeat protein, partial [Planctomycetes bacterium]|nr:tetratricopeptide repeat protein [Planctomycetota bacterium]
MRLASLALLACMTLGAGSVHAATASYTFADEKDGWSLFRKRDYAGALKRFEREEKKYPEWAELQDAMGWCEYYVGDLKKAEEHFKEALRIKEDYKWSLMGLEALEAKRKAPIESAQGLLAAGRYVEAKAAFQRILEGKTDATDAAEYAAECGEGWCHFYLGDFRDALKSFRKAHKTDRDDADALRGIGWSEFGQGDYRRALTALQLALDVDPSHFAARTKSAWAHYWLEDYEEALADFTAAKTLSGATYEAWSGAGWSQLRMGHEDAALAEFAQAIGHSPYAKDTQLSQVIETHPAWRTLHNIAGWSALRSSLYSWALAEFEYSEQLGVDVGEAVAGQAFALFRMERYDEALAHIEQAANLDGAAIARDFPITLSNGILAQVHMNLDSLTGWIAYRQGRYDQALEAFRGLRAANKGWVDAICGEAWVLYAQGNYPAAEQAFGKALELLPFYPDAVSGQQAIEAWRYYDYNRAWTLLLEGKTEEARTVFESIQTESHNSFPRDRMELVEASLGWVDSWSGQLEPAVGHFREALRLHPKLGLAERGWGELELHRDRWDDAERHLLVALQSEEYKDDADTWMNLGRAQEQGLKMKEAGEAFQKAVRLGPTLARTHVAQALYFLRVVAKVDARVALERAIAIDPSVADGGEVRARIDKEPELFRLHAPLGWAWYYRGEYTKAQTEFELAVELDPLETSAQRGLGFSLLKQSKFEQAQDVLDGYLKEMPSSEDPWGDWSTTLSTLAWALYGNGDYNDASKYFRKLMALHKNQKLAYADPFDGLGWCSLKQGKERQARKFFE